MTAVFTDEQEALLASPLDSGRVKKRQGRGNGPALSYLETHDVIRTANAVFGFGQWGHEIIELREIPAVAVTSRDNKPGIHVGYVCVIRLSVQGCVPVSGVGYGDAVEYNQSAPVTAHELAAKEAESDALKRALKNYGDQFGLALYDKAAALSGHVVTEKPAVSSAAPAAGVAAPAATQAQRDEFQKLAETWAQLDKEFDLAATLASAASKDAGWLARAGKRLQEKITGAIDAPQEAFPIPDTAKPVAA